MIKSIRSGGGKTDIKILEYRPAPMFYFALRPTKLLSQSSLPQKRDLICRKKIEADATLVWLLKACQTPAHLPYSAVIELKHPAHQ
jgi:hypothetical protein